MRRPPLQTRLAGHALIAIPTQLFSAVVLFLAWRAGEDALIPGGIAACMLAYSLKATETCFVYEQWRREWDAMDGASPRRGSTIKTVVGGLLVAVFTVAVVAVHDTGHGTEALQWVVGLGLILGAILGPIYVVRRIMARRTARPIKAVPVKVVAQCIMRPVPLNRAFTLLPDHCQQILSGGRS